MLGERKYIDLETGEIKKCVEKQGRLGHIESLKRTFRNLRGIINANTSKPENNLFITLTYAQKMSDTEQLYRDWCVFLKRLRRYIRREYDTSFEYIAVPEPQSGDVKTGNTRAWHFHVLLIFAKRAPFIPNTRIKDLWGNGFVKVQRLTKIGGDNIGNYLTAYLTDIPLNELERAYAYGTENLNTKKEIVKGARLIFYPAKINIIRHSKGIKYPQVRYMTYQQFQEEVMRTYTKVYSYRKEFEEEKPIIIEKEFYVKYKND